MSILAVLAKLYIAGVDISWKQFHTSLSLNLRKVDLPFYPFQRQRYWYPPYDKKEENNASSLDQLLGI
jgi:acyl transferase domain-containing protein